MSDVKKLNHEQVMEIIPHRDPMLLIDEATEFVPGERIVATFWVDPAREIFKGHFPGDPVLPGVYTVEATAQATDLVLMTKPEYVGKTPLFLGINNVRFRKKILPGDTLEIHSELMSERPEKAIATCKSPPAIWRRKHGAPSPCAEGLFLSRIPWAFHIQKAARCLNTAGHFFTFCRGNLLNTLPAQQLQDLGVIFHCRVGHGESAGAAGDHAA